MARMRPKQQRSSKEIQEKSSPSAQTVSAIHLCFCFLDGLFIDEQASLLVQERGLPYILGQTSLNLILLTTKNDWKQSSTNPTKQFLIAFAMKSLGMDEQMVLFINSGVQERREHSALCLIHSSIYAVCPKGFHNQHGKTQRGSV